MICPAPVTAAMAAVRLRDILNEDAFRETYSLHLSTAAYSSLLQITSDYVNITLSYSLLLPITYILYSLLHITHWYYYMDTSSLLYITSYYCIVYFILLQKLLLHYF
jgi:hypothetical protein